MILSQMVKKVVTEKERAEEVKIPCRLSEEKSRLQVDRRNAKIRPRAWGLCDCGRQGGQSIWDQVSKVRCGWRGDEWQGASHKDLCDGCGNDTGPGETERSFLSFLLLLL